MKRQLESFHIVTLCALLLAFANRANATLLAYEGFNYTAGESLTNASANSAGNSFGWAGRWTGANSALATNASGNLSYNDGNGNTLLTDGGKVTIGVPAGISGANAQPSRSFNFGTLNNNIYTGLTNSAATYWASFVMQWIGQPTAGSTTNLYVRKGDLVFRQGAQTNATSTGTQLYSVGSPNAANRIGAPYDTWSTWTGADAAGGTLNTGFAAATNPLTTLTFVLLRIDLDGGSASDTIYTWFNWTNLTVEPPIATASTTNNTANEDGLNNIRLDANGGNAAGTNTVLSLDEFRLGTTFADVSPLASAPQPPTITMQPQSKTVTVGDAVTISITATGAPPLYYQWFLNATNSLANQTNNSYIIASASTNDTGSYFCVVTNSNGSETSLVATLTVELPAAPDITSQPQNFTNMVGFNATFSVAATGTAPLRYQWYFNGASALANKTNSTLTFTIASTSDAGSYSVIVTNLYGSKTSSVATLTVVPGSPSGLPAFPGADGAAKLVSGGRGGIVYHVTKLDRNFNHNEAGTLRYGMTDGNFPSGVPRTIVFDVGGVFWLGRYGAESNHMHGWDTSSRYNLSGNTTIAGQTAPGPVIIAGGVTKPGSVNTIVRNITFAPSYGTRNFQDDPNTPPTPGDFPDSYVFDALDISGQNIMLDHLTAVYSTDETISCNELATNLTIQYCNIAQGENYPQADAENPGVYTGHALGSLLQAGSNAKISVLNNLYAHLKGRLPRVGSEVGTGALNDFRNNVFYNWFGTAGSGASGQPSFDNFINNFYLTGPGGDNVSGTNITTGNSGGTGIFSGSDSSLTRVYHSGNFKDTNNDGDPNDTNALANGDFGSSAFQSAAFDVNVGVTLSATAGFTNTLRYVGSRWWTRPYDFTAGNTNAITTNDIAAYVDERLIKETVTGTGKIIAWIDDPFDTNANEGLEWQTLLALRADPTTFAAPFNHPANWDTDGDGIPDYWEVEHGLNTNAPNNNADFDTDGYKDLEEYLNELAAWPAPGVIQFTGNTNSRYAEIFNWQVNGQQVSVTNLGTITTFSLWQPSRYDTALISNLTCAVDAVGQRAGTLRLTNSAALNITGGWLSVSNCLQIATNCTVAVETSGGLRVTNCIVNNGTVQLNGAASLYVGGWFTNNGVLDITSWSGTLPAGFVNNGTVLTNSYTNFVHIESFQINGANFEVTVQSLSGHNYQLQKRDDLTSGAWSSAGSAVAGTGSTITLVHANGATAQQRYYRVAVNP